MRVFVVIPAWNEGPHIREVIAEILKYSPFVVVVDDGSSDHTACAASESGAIVLHHSVNRGQGAALKTGTIFALQQKADYIIHMDADGQHNSEFLQALLDPLIRNEVDVVFGSRYLGENPEGMPWMRSFVHSCARLFNRYALGIPRAITDPQNGLRAMSAEAARQIQFFQDGFAHCSEILQLVTRSTLRWCEVPVRVRYTKESLAKGPNALRIMWQLFLGKFQRHL